MTKSIVVFLFSFLLGFYFFLDNYIKRKYRLLLLQDYYFKYILAIKKMSLTARRDSYCTEINPMKVPEEIRAKKSTIIFLFEY